MTQNHLNLPTASDAAQLGLLDRCIADLIIISRQVARLRRDENVAESLQHLRTSIKALINERSQRGTRAEKALYHQQRRDYEQRLLESSSVEIEEIPPELTE